MEEKNIRASHVKKTEDEILSAVQEYISRNGYPPTVREIGNMVNINSTGTVQRYIEKMFGDHLLETNHRNSARALHIPGYQMIPYQFVISELSGLRDREKKKGNTDLAEAYQNSINIIKQFTEKTQNNES